MVLDAPKRNGTPDPFLLSVAAHDIKVFDVTDQDSVPVAIDHSIDVWSANGVPVVAEQVFTGGPPWNRVGATVVPGATLEATQWLFASGGVSPRRSEQLVLRNPGRRIVTADVRTLTDDPGRRQPELTRIVVPSGGRTTVRLDALKRPDLGVHVVASGPIVAERAVYLRGRPGIAFGMGVPLAGHARVVADG